MTEYEYNDDKPEKLLTGYNTIRGAELKEIYNVLETQGELPFSALKDRFARPKTGSTERNTVHVDRCLKFLRAVDMVEVSAQNVVSHVNRDVYSDINAFEPRLLHHLRQQEGEQYHLSYVFDVAVKMDRRRIPESELLEEVIGSEERSFGLSWNEDNVRMWANMADTIGAVSYLNRGDTNRVLISPAPVLLADLLSWYQANGTDSTRFARALEWIDEGFLPVFKRTAGGVVSAGVADVLNNMEQDGVLSLRSMSDTEDTVRVPRSGREGGRNVATYSVHDVPDRPRYWYPLDRNERRIHA
jgi:hypothetical protein